MSKKRSAADAASTDVERPCRELRNAMPNLFANCLGTSTTSGVVFSHNKRTFLQRAADQYQLISVHDGAPPITLEDCKPETFLAYSPDDQWIVDGKSAHAWSTKDGHKHPSPQPFRHTQKLRGAEINNAGTQFALYDDRCVSLWDVENFQLRAFETMKCGEMARFTADDQFLVPVFDQTNMLNTQTCKLEPVKIKSPAFCVIYDNSRTHYLSSNGCEKSTERVLYSSKDDVKCGKPMSGFRDAVSLFKPEAVADTGALVAGLNMSEQVCVWDVNTGLPLRTVKTTGDKVQRMRFDRTGRYLMMHCQESIRRLDLQTKKEVKIPHDRSTHIFVAFSPTGEFYLRIDNGEQVRLFHF